MSGGKQPAYAEISISDYNRFGPGLHAGHLGWHFNCRWSCLPLWRRGCGNLFSQKTAENRLFVMAIAAAFLAPGEILTFDAVALIPDDPLRVRPLARPLNAPDRRRCRYGWRGEPVMFKAIALDGNCGIQTASACKFFCSAVPGP